jgi:chromosome segregation ATPase
LKDKAWADQTKPAPAIPATDIQEEIREHLNELQSEIIQLQSLQKLVGVLQEERMTATERLDDQNRQIEELTERIEAMKRREQTLHEKNAQLEKQLQDQVVPETQVIDNGTEVGVYLQKQRVATKEREIALRAQVEELRSAMGSKEDERRSLARKVEAMQSEVRGTDMLLSLLLTSFRE